MKGWMRPLRVLHTEWSNGWGGQEIRILSECVGLAARGHRVELAGCPEGRLRRRAGEAGLVFHPLPMAGPWDLRAVWRLVRLLRRGGFDILHTHSSVDSWVGGVAARMAGVACVRTRHLSAPVSTHPLNIVYRLPRAVITTGEGIRRHLVEDYGLPAERVFSIPTGVDTTRFRPREPDPELQAELGLGPEEPVVGMVAVLRSWKRHDLFCRMARMLLDQGRKARFLIVGEGPGRERVSGYLEELELRPAVIMTGHREDVERILSLCTVVVLCSDRNEGVPQAVLQAMACARPVVAAAAGDVPQVVRDGRTGLLVPPGEAGPLARAVARLLEDAALRRRLGEAGRRLVESSYSQEGMLEATEQLYARVLQGEGVRA